MSRRRRKARRNRRIEAAARAAASVRLRDRDLIITTRRRTAYPSAVPGVPILKAAPRQRRASERRPLELPTEKRKTRLRAATKAALVVGQQGPLGRRRRQQLHPMSRIAQRALCAEYDRAKRQRRETLFATGKGGSNPGPRVRDWRAEACR